MADDADVDLILEMTFGWGFFVLTRRGKCDTRADFNSNIREGKNKTKHAIICLCLSLVSGWNDEYILQKRKIVLAPDFVQSELRIQQRRSANKKKKTFKIETAWLNAKQIRMEQKLLYHNEVGKGAGCKSKSSSSKWLCVLGNGSSCVTKLTQCL